MEENKRDYKKEHEREREMYKRYTAKIPLYLANLLDTKLQNEGLTFTEFLKNAIEKYLKKN